MIIDKYFDFFKNHVKIAVFSGFVAQNKHKEKKMKKSLFGLSVLSLVVLSGCATYPNSTAYAPQQEQLVYRNGYYYRQVPQQEPQYQRSGGDTGGAVIGTMAGGLIGSQVGKGNGRLAAAAVGGAVGGVVGSGCRTTNGGQIIGALAGGILGSKIGQGNGQVAATAIGASIGAQAGGDMAGGCLGN